MRDIYAEVRKLRLAPHPATLDAIIRRTIEQHSSDSEAFDGDDLFYSVDGLGGGVWGLRGKVAATPLAVDLPDLPPQETKRTLSKTYRILRDTQLARSLKTIHKHCCQVCGLAIELPDGSRYSEAHHIRPLGGEHKGPDVAGNILVLCPNHHVQCDYGVLKLQVAALRMHEKHRVLSEYVEYHNQRVHGKWNSEASP